MFIILRIWIKLLRNPNGCGWIAKHGVREGIFHRNEARLLFTFSAIYIHHLLLQWLI